MMRKKASDNYRSKSMNVMVIGDAGVGKSSLVSTFLSRQFSETVPGTMARIRVPVEAITTTSISSSPTATSGAAVNHGKILNNNKLLYSTTTIIDTQNEEATTISSTAGEEDTKTGEGSSSNNDKLCGISAERINAIVLVYSLDKMDTFVRLESYWLPLIEHIFTNCNSDTNVKMLDIPPVIIAGNQMDLENTDEQSQARSRHQIVSLLQQFKFVRQCIKCSAKNMWNVNDVFLKAQHAVLYPINPLFDLSDGKLSTACELALTHIFRLFDIDRDNLLSDDEMKLFQRYCFNAPLIDRDLASWKKILSKNNPNENILQGNKFTIKGFYGIFDTYISSDRIEIPWIVLRSFGYDDNLQLNDIPTSSFSASSQFSPSEIQFLILTFHQFDSNHDGFLSSSDISSIFPISSFSHDYDNNNNDNDSHSSLPPWNPARAKELFQTCYSQPFPKHFCSTLSSSSDLLLSLDQWMNRWNMVTAISPLITRRELYCLGYEPNILLSSSADKKTSSKIRGKSTKNSKVMTLLAPSIGSNTNAPKQHTQKHLSSKVIRIAVIGSSRCGKTTLLNNISDSQREDLSSASYCKTVEPLTTCAVLDFNLKGNTVASNTLIHYIFTEIPEEDASHKLSLMPSSSSFLFTNNSSSSNNEHQQQNQTFDLILFLFDPSNLSSLQFIFDLETNYLNDDIPRVFIALHNANELCFSAAHINPDAEVSTSKDYSSVKASSIDLHKNKETSALHKAMEHCTKLDLESPYEISFAKCQFNRSQFLHHIGRFTLDSTNNSYHLHVKPFAERKRRENAARRTIIWIGGFVAAAAVVVASVVMLWNKNSTDNRSSSRGVSNGIKVGNK